MDIFLVLILYLRKSVWSTSLRILRIIAISRRFRVFHVMVAIFDAWVLDDFRRFSFRDLIDTSSMMFAMHRNLLSQKQM